MARSSDSSGGRLDREDPNLVPTPQNISSVMSQGRRVPAPVQSAPPPIGESAAPKAAAPQSAPQDFNAKVARNESFLSSPAIQNSLLDFAINILAPGMTTEERQNQQKLDMEQEQFFAQQNIAQQRLGIDQAQLGIQMEELQDKRDERQIAIDAKKRRSQLFSMVSNKPGEMNEMDPIDLLDLAGELAADGDDDGAKIAIQMADTKRQTNSTPDLIEYKAYRMQGGKMLFNDWQHQKILTGVQQSPLADMDPKLTEEAIKQTDNADLLDAQVAELQGTRELVKTAATGQLTPLTLPIRAALAQVGVTFGEDIKQIDLLQSLRAQQGQLALRMRNPASGFGLPGAASDNDLKFLKEIVGSIANTPNANEAILTVMMAKQRRAAGLARLKSEYIFENKTLKGWGERQKEFVEQNEFFTPDEKSLLTKMANPNASTPGEIKPPAKSVGIPAAAPDGLTEEQQTRWPHYDDAYKRYLLGMPDEEEAQ